MRHSFLKMKNSKMDIMMFGTRNQHNKITTSAIDFSDTTVKHLSQPYLGILLNQNLTLKAHILSKVRKASYHLYWVRQIIKFLDLPAKQTLI